MQLIQDSLFSCQVEPQFNTQEEDKDLVKSIRVAGYLALNQLLLLFSQANRVRCVSIWTSPLNSDQISPGRLSQLCS